MTGGSPTRESSFILNPAGVEAAFRKATGLFAGKAVPKLVGDCYLLAHAQECHATLVTFDSRLLALAAKHGHKGVRPSGGSE